MSEGERGAWEKGTKQWVDRDFMSEGIRGRHLRDLNCVDLSRAQKEYTRARCCDQTPGYLSTEREKQNEYIIWHIYFNTYMRERKMQSNCFVADSRRLDISSV